MERGSFKIRLRSNAKELAREFGDIARKQVPFATSRALNILADESRDAERARFGKVFKSRNKAFRKRLQSSHGRKSQRPITAAVGHKDAFMIDHEVGKVRRRTTKGGRQTVPTRLVGRTSTGKIRAHQKPSRLISSKQGRLSRQGRGREAMVLRSAKGLRKTDRRRNLSGGGVYWLLLRRVKIKPRWRFRASVKKHVRRRYQSVFVRELEQAIRSRRVRSGSFTSEQGRAAFIAAGQRMSAEEG